MGAVQGGVGHGNADSEAPVKIGGKASSSAPTNVDAGDRVDGYFDLAGRQVVLIDSASDLTIDTGDIEIGAVEIKNGTDDTRATVTAANALKVDASGVAVPVTDNSGSLTVDNAQLSVVGGGAEATAMRVTLANDSTGVVSVDDNGGNLSVDWAGTVPPIGAGTEAAALRVTLATDSTGLVSVDDNASSLTVDNAALSVVGGGAEATAMRVTLANDSTGVVSVDDNGSALTVDWAGTAPPIGGGTEATALKVTVASDSSGVLSVDDNGSSLTVDGTAVSPAKSATATTSLVADTGATAQLLAANASRLGTIITNDSSARLYIKLGTTASTTDYTVSLAQHGTYELPGPHVYTGRIDGIWATDPGDGAARITELT